MKRAIGLLICLLLVVPLVHGALRTFSVEETDEVVLNPVAQDLDGDQVNFSYSKPFDENGVWQTTYGDAGEYRVTITASDGKSTTQEEVAVVVAKKNRGPVLTVGTIEAKENVAIDLKQYISDPDGDELSYTFSAPFDKNGIWIPSFQDAGEYQIAIQVDDGKLKLTDTVLLNVAQVNQPPTITQVFSDAKTISIAEGEELAYSVVAQDGDGQTVTYQWRLDGQLISEAFSGKYVFAFNSSGEHLLEVIISDGKSTITRSWTINVAHTNQVPFFTHVPIVVKENEEVRFDLPQVDADGEQISYTFSSPVNEAGVWTPSFEDAGEYEIRVIASDGTDTFEGEVNIRVENVDRAPVIGVTSLAEFRENQEGSFYVSTSDPDGEEVEVTFAGLPYDASYDEDTGRVSWTPSFDAIKRRPSIVANLLNALRIEQKLLRKDNFVVNVRSCANNLCSNKDITFRVFNQNRDPVLEQPQDVFVKEMEKVSVLPQAQDADRDIVKFYFTDPLGKRSGEWIPHYWTAGEHTAYVTASDGQAVVTKPVRIVVENVNRKPVATLSETQVYVNENETLAVSIDMSDEDGDFTWVEGANLPQGAFIENNTLYWTPTYDVVASTNGSRQHFVSSFSFTNKRWNAERVTLPITLLIKDAYDTVNATLTVHVANWNRGPQVAKQEENVTVQVGVPALFSVDAQDADADDLTYEWSFGPGEAKVSGKAVLERTFVTSGVKKVQVEVSDGLRSVTKQWNVLAQETTYQTPSYIEQDAFAVYVIG